jgi:hypothetical protein
MKLEGIAGNAITAVVVAGILGVFAWVGGVFEAGTVALDKEVIRAVLQEEMKTDAGITYGAALSQIGLDINTVSTQVGILQTDVRDLEQSIFDLASE